MRQRLGHRMRCTRCSARAIAIVVAIMAVSQYAHARAVQPVTYTSPVGRHLGWWSVEIDGGLSMFGIGGFVPDLLKFFPYTWCLHLSEATTGTSFRCGVHVSHRLGSWSTISLASSFQRYSIGTSGVNVNIDQLALEPSMRFDLHKVPMYFEIGASGAIIVHQRGTGTKGVTNGVVAQERRARTYESNAVGTPRPQFAAIVGLGGYLAISDALVLTASVRARTAFTNFFREYDPHVRYSIEPGIGMAWVFL
jgi:hypothetical protein